MKYSLGQIVKVIKAPYNVGYYGRRVKITGLLPKIKAYSVDFTDSYFFEDELRADRLGERNG